jgi:integrase
MPRNLTPQFIKAMEPPASGNRVEWDTQEPGLGVRITAGGHRAFVLRYVAQGRERRMTLGAYPTLTLTAAREIARSRKGEVVKGGDPLARKQERRDAMTLGKAVALYLAGREAGTIGHRRPKPRSMEELRRALELHWKPLHPLPLAEIDHVRIEGRLHEMVDAKTGRGRVAANRAREALSALFSWATRKQYVPTNPVALADRMVPENELKRDRVLTAPEIKLLWRATEGPGEYRALVRLLLLTGQRREEVAAMRWSELDLDAALWSLPKERTKNGLRHDVPLSDAALAILRTIPRRPGRDLLFGDGEGSFSAWSQSKSRLDVRLARLRAEARLGRPLGAGEEPDVKLDRLPAWRVHDLRRTLVTGMNELRILPHVVEAVVNHVSGDAKRGVAGRYNHAQYNAEKRQALARWADHVMALVTEEPSKVVPMRRQTA